MLKNSKMENQVVYQGSRTPEEVSHLTGFELDMRLAAISQAARVVVLRSLGLPCGGSIFIRKQEAPQEMTWGEYPCRGALKCLHPDLCAAGFAALFAVEKYSGNDKPLATVVWDGLNTGKYELSQNDRELASGAVLADVALCAALVNSLWPEILEEQSCIIAETIMRLAGSVSGEDLDPATTAMEEPPAASSVLSRASHPCRLARLAASDGRLNEGIG